MYESYLDFRGMSREFPGETYRPQMTASRNDYNWPSYPDGHRAFLNQYPANTRDDREVTPMPDSVERSTDGLFLNRDRTGTPHSSEPTPLRFSIEASPDGSFVDQDRTGTLYDRDVAPDAFSVEGTSRGPSGSTTASHALSNTSLRADLGAPPVGHPLIAKLRARMDIYERIETQGTPEEERAKKVGLYNKLIQMLEGDADRPFLSGRDMSANEWAKILVGDEGDCITTLLAIRERNGPQGLFKAVDLDVLHIEATSVERLEASSRWKVESRALLPTDERLTGFWINDRVLSREQWLRAELSAIEGTGQPVTYDDLLRMSNAAN
ncbi:MAG: hypothetical protein M1828_005260 [Chrysothrix sp. TS-e1954]|nr:MAG: hypothetical protein M1828_005260 [Chrysothrix sp. TS-e1954]